MKALDRNWVFLWRRELAKPTAAFSWLQTALGLCSIAVVATGSTLTSEDAYIKTGRSRWELGTASVAKTLTIEDGQLRTLSFLHKLAGRELLPPGGIASEFSAICDMVPVDGAAGPWTLVEARTAKLPQGELQLELTLQRAMLRVQKTYVVHPGSSLIREWVTFHNAGPVPLRLVEPGFLNFSARLGEPDSLQFHWMTGGKNRVGSWLLKTETLVANQPRRFDSYDPFPGTISKFPGDGDARMGSSSYAPWTALFDRANKVGLFIGWDYFGHWSSSYTLGGDGTVTAQLRVAGHRQTLAPGESVTTPKAFVGLFRDDLDNAGNECLDWQYRYMWDYTRAGWFPAIRALHWWSKGTGWGLPGTPWTGGNADPISTYCKILRTADFMRYTGVDVYHRDWGWWDCAGDWNGPDFRGMNEYLRKHQMGLLIYAVLYSVDMKSKVAREHPDWVLGRSTLDMSRPDVVAFIQGQLDDFAARYGDFEWRNDSNPLCPRDGDDTPLLAQDQGLRQIIRTFLDRHPGCGFHAVNGGGNRAGYDYARYASSIQFSDGRVGIIRNYWAALLLPPDKSNDQPDISNPDKFDKATWRGTLCCNFDTTGDTWNAEKLDGLRELNDIYHYLQGQGVVGRWVHVYRPLVTGDDPTLYFQRLSGDARHCLLIPKRPAPGPITLKPKGLLPKDTYFVNFQESAASETRTGADLMEKGIFLKKMEPGELIYLNLPYHPGNKLDKVVPRPPRRVGKQRADNIGYPGIEIAWKPGTDDRWVSHYEILRSGMVIDKVAKGTFYFDRSAGADLAARYEVRTVDGAGNRSAAAPARGPAARPAHIVDDAPGGEVVFSQGWQLQRPPALVAHQGTITATKQKGASAELTFTGQRIIWFIKLGADCGQAAVSIDGGAPETVDTYAADDIWGVGVYRKEFSAAGRHTLRIAVLGKHSPRAKDSYVHLDGFRVE